MAILAAALLPAQGQVWDFTGNNLLNGSYVFRELVLVGSSTGIVSRAVSVYGTITFNSGSGTYTIAANAIDSQAGSFSYTQVTNATYSISPNGYGFIRHPYATNGFLHGMVSNGVFIGSATEAGVNDVMIAVPASSATTANFAGNYTMDYFYTGGGNYTGSYNTIAQLNPNGSGGIGSVATKTYLGSAVTPVNLTENNVSYSFSGGVGTLTFPTSGQPAIGGTKQMYISPDGNLIFGGSTATGNSAIWDFFIGVKRSSGAAPALSGLYYQAGFNHNPGGLDTFYGAFTARAGTILEHQRYLSTANTVALNYTASAVYPSGGGTDYTDTISDVEYTVSQDGAIRIGAGQSPYLGLRIAVRGPTFITVGTNPYIDPTGIVNAASYAPFTTGLAPGELVSIYGSNLAGSTLVTQGGTAFPTTLGGVQVLMNNRPAALYFVSPGQIAAIVPYGTTESIVQVQVVRNGVTSNAVTMYRYLTSPGIFSQGQSGEGLGAVLRANYSVATEANQARVGETVQIFLTGIGAVFPSIADGGLGSTNAASLNQTAPGTVKVYIGNVAADVTYSGLAPGLAGLYQVNATVPSGTGSGNVYLDISTADSYTSQVALPVASSASDAVEGLKAIDKDPPHRR
ncbi:MAG: hypothetical protein RL328_590 [Acidobacteriota bacterium]